MKEIGRQIISALMASICLAGLSAWTGYEFWFSILISGAIGFGIYFSIPAKKTDHEIVNGTDRELLDAALEDITGYIGKLSDLEKLCPKKEPGNYIQAMINTLRKISSYFQESPDNIADAHIYLKQYMEMSLSIISQYAKLSKVSFEGKRKEQLVKAEETISRIRKGLKDFYHKCLENELIDLEVSSGTFEAVFDMELPDTDIDEKE